MIYWEEESLNDREKIFEYLYQHNPLAAEKTDDLIEKRVEHLSQHPLMGVSRAGMKGRLLVLPEVSLLIVYALDGSDIRVLRVLHQKQRFPELNSAADD